MMIIIECCHQRKLGKGYMRSLCIISYNCMWIYNYLKIKSLIKKNQSGTICPVVTTIHMHPNIKYIHSLFYNPQSLLLIKVLVPSIGSNHLNQVEMQMSFCTSNTIPLNLKTCELKGQVIHLHKLCISYLLW